jgi:hypothetical protein
MYECCCNNYSGPEVFSDEECQRWNSHFLCPSCCNGQQSTCTWQLAVMSKSQAKKMEVIVPNIDPNPITKIEDILTPIRPSYLLPLPQSTVTVYDIIRSFAIELWISLRVLWWWCRQFLPPFQPPQILSPPGSQMQFVRRPVLVRERL